MPKKTKPRVKIEKITDPGTLRVYNIAGGAAYFATYKGRLITEVRSTEARAQAEADAYIAANYSDIEQWR